MRYKKITKHKIFALIFNQNNTILTHKAKYLILILLTQRLNTNNSFIMLIKEVKNGIMDINDVHAARRIYPPITPPVRGVYKPKKMTKFFKLVYPPYPPKTTAINNLIRKYFLWEVI